MGGTLASRLRALTGSPALTLWPCPRHRDLAYQRRLRQARGPGPEDVGCRHLTKFARTHHKLRPVPGATRLEVGPRESRAGSWAPKYASPASSRATNNRLIAVMA